MKHIPCVFICAHLSRDGARLSCREEEWWTFCIASAKSRHSHFHYHLSTHPSDQREDLDAYTMHPIHTHAAAASRITICCCTTSQFVIVLVLHVCWYTYLQFGTATSKCMRPCGYTCSLYLCADGDKRQAPGWDGPACPQRRGCPAGVQTARASNAAACSHLSPAAAQLCPVLETPCILMLICVLRHYRKKDKYIT